MNFIYSLICKVPFIKKFIEVEKKGKFGVKPKLRCIC